MGRACYKVQPKNLPRSWLPKTKLFRAVYSRSLRGKYVNGYVVGATAFLDSAKNGSLTVSGMNMNLLP